jgi:hypothetical protein
MRFISQFLLFFLLLSILSILSYLYLGRPAPGMDDADIFLNYARRASTDVHMGHSKGDRIQKKNKN